MDSSDSLDSKPSDPNRRPLGIYGSQSTVIDRGIHGIHGIQGIQGTCHVGDAKDGIDDARDYSSTPETAIGLLDEIHLIKHTMRSPEY